ncbi:MULTISPECIES: DUF1488 domain-containing protein [Burkholderiaceae]|uniref:DUF1488 domain-containing protein n=1 Tax=Burkholderiaceae TaxID=119060 RepID=UPI000963B95F|nr:MULTISPECIES: DUF1488 domain-containing protein [Burkholderiaceae]MCG1040580.1 DUF1488 domain-containing protein [Mycetohabitans sp. B7]SIT65411.1 Protein of unknown function [Burkholderia sp. b14]
MEIIFVNTPPEFRDWNLAVGFTAKVDDRQVDCSISAEALEDHFGAESTDPGDLLAAFDRHRAAIEHAAFNVLQGSGFNEILLRSGYLRFQQCREAARATQCG